MREEFAVDRELFRDRARRNERPTLDEVHMNRFKAIGSTLLFVPALAFVSTQARAEFKCDAPSGFDRVACEKAKESPQALRQYIQRIAASKVFTSRT